MEEVGKCVGTVKGGKGRCRRCVGGCGECGEAWIRVGYGE